MGTSIGLRFFSPCYIGDLERFILLRKSIRRFAKCDVQHVVAVPRQDIATFLAHLGDDNGLRVLAQEEFVARQFYAPQWFRWLNKIAGKRSWRFAGSRFAGRPGWIIQQIVKLSAPEVFRSGAVAIVDSDVVFIREFSESDIVPGDGRRIVLRDEPICETAKQRQLMARAREILKIAPGSTEHHYMAYPAIWYIDWVLSLRNDLERMYGKPWQQVLFDANSFSEYLLYGIYVEEKLRPAGLEVRTVPFQIGVWDRADYDLFIGGNYPWDQSQERSRPLTFVVQSNIGVAVREYTATLERFVDTTPH